MSEPEPWLRGPMDRVPAHLQPVFFSFQQAREDLSRYTAGLKAEHVWREVAGKHSLGFHLKHIAGSVDRLSTYLAGRQLSKQQLTFLAQEHSPDTDLVHLLALCESRFAALEGQVLSLPAESLLESRTVGRRKLPTTVLGLLLHICEHTQRHLGQAILLSRLLQEQ